MQTFLKTILIVEDDTVMQGYLHALLKQEARIVTADNCHDALITLQSVKIDLMLLDNELPDMQGINLLNVMQCEPRLASIPVLMVTGSTAPHAAQKAMARGAMEYITKPFVPEQLLKKVQHRLKKNERRIMVVDDDITTRFMLSQYFQKTGVEVIEAADGPSAMTLAQQQPLQLIVMDRGLPGMDGVQVMQLLREQNRTKYIPVMMLTGMTQAADIEEGFRFGADDYMVKPFTLDDVIIRAMRLMSLPASRLSS